VTGWGRFAKRIWVARVVDTNLRHRKARTARQTSDDAKESLRSGSRVLESINCTPITIFAITRDSRAR